MTNPNANLHRVITAAVFLLDNQESPDYRQAIIEMTGELLGFPPGKGGDWYPAIEHLLSVAAIDAIDGVIEL